jgi:hypothetical protein
VSWDLVIRHVAAAKATLTQIQISVELVHSQLSHLDALAKAEQGKTQDRATILAPETCKAHKAEDCARVSEDAVIELGGMGGSEITLMCRGCGLSPR